jgi:hypothetical protein
MAAPHSGQIAIFVPALQRLRLQTRSSACSKTSKSSEGCRASELTKMHAYLENVRGVIGAFGRVRAAFAPTEFGVQGNNISISDSSCLQSACSAPQQRSGASEIGYGAYNQCDLRHIAGFLSELERSPQASSWITRKPQVEAV